MTKLKDAKFDLLNELDFDIEDAMFGDSSHYINCTFVFDSRSEAESVSELLKLAVSKSHKMLAMIVKANVVLSQSLIALNAFYKEYGESYEEIVKTTQTLSEITKLLEE